MGLDAWIVGIIIMDEGGLWRDFRDSFNISYLGRQYSYFALCNQCISIRVVIRRTYSV
jgi:hypothetical protein